MHYDSIKIAVFALAALTYCGTAAAETPLMAFNPEIISTLKDWDPESGHITLNGELYTVSEHVEVVTPDGEPISPEAMPNGSKVGVLEKDGTVLKIIVLDK